MQACKQQLDALLFDAHMTRADLARAFGVAPESISRWKHLIKKATWSGWRDLNPRRQLGRLLLHL